MRMLYRLQDTDMIGTLAEVHDSQEAFMIMKVIDGALPESVKFEANVFDDVFTIMVAGENMRYEYPFIVFSVEMGQDAGNIFCYQDDHGFNFAGYANVFEGPGAEIIEPTDEIVSFDAPVTYYVNFRDGTLDVDGVEHSFDVSDAEAISIEITPDGGSIVSYQEIIDDEEA